MEDFDLIIYLDKQHAWLKATQHRGNLSARHRGTLEDKQYMADILITLGNQLKKEKGTNKDELS